MVSGLSRKGRHWWNVIYLPTFFIVKVKKKLLREVMTAVLSRGPKMCSFIEMQGFKLVYKRYASLFFCCAIGDITHWLSSSSSWLQHKTTKNDQQKSQSMVAFLKLKVANFFNCLNVLAVGYVGQEILEYWIIWIWQRYFNQMFQLLLQRRGTTSCWRWR